MAIYTFTNILNKEILLFQVSSENYEEALNQWCTEVIQNSESVKVSESYLLKKVNKVHVNKIMVNTWTFTLQIKSADVIVYFTRTDEEEENQYEIQDAGKFIYDKLPENVKKRIEFADVENILEYADHFLSGIHKDTSAFTEDEIISFIVSTAKKEDKTYLSEDIEKVLEVEIEYLKEIGFVDPDMCYFMGLSFDKPSEN